MDLDPTTFASMTPEEFARLVTGMSDTEVAAQLRGEHRVAILDAIFGRMPELFRPDRAKGVSRLVTGRINPMIAVMRGKITVRGDLALASRFSSFFDMPKG